MYIHIRESLTDSSTRKMCKMLTMILNEPNGRKIIEVQNLKIQRIFCDIFRYKAL